MKTGSPYPLGASVTATGVNFSVFSYHATRAELLLFDTEDATEPSRVSMSRSLESSGFCFSFIASWPLLLFVVVVPRCCSPPCFYSHFE